MEDTQMREEKAMERSYSNALRIIESRRRASRPKQPGFHKHGRGEMPSTHARPDLRGSPSIVGMSEWLRLIGHAAEDIDKLNIIHIAGTKGKGSSCAFTESFLRAHGQRTGFPYKTGLYTSPHLSVPEERIRIDSKPISSTLFAKYFFEVYDRLPQLAKEYDSSLEPIERGPRNLQLYALLAFHAFLREKVTVTILETHNGGEYDATNVVEHPVVTAVTTLGMDHVDILGPTIENIAWHKGGIYKAHAVLLSAPQDPAPAEVLKSRGVEKGEVVRFVELERRLPMDAEALRPGVQKINASVAAAAAQEFLKRCSPDGDQDLTPADLTAGVEQFSWPGRFQVILDEEATWFLDAAHNDMSVGIAADWFINTSEHLPAENRDKSICRILIFSHINETRNTSALLASLARSLKDAGAGIDHVIFSTYDETEEKKSSSVPDQPDLFHDTWAKFYPQTKMWDEPTIQGAIVRARHLGSGRTHTLITGSQHLVGPALRVLGWDPHA